MKLLELGHTRWRVLAVCDRKDDCPVLDFLLGLDRSIKRSRDKMLHDLRVTIPERGPDFHNPDHVKKMKDCDDIYELREQPGKGPKLRVLFFKDGDSIIVCTEGFLKRDETPEAALRRAERVKEQYFSDKQRKDIQVEIY